MSADLKAAPAAAAALAAAPASWQRTVLLDDAELLIEWHRRTPAHDTVVVTFDPYAWGLELVAFGGEFLRRGGADTIAVRKKREHFYQPLSRERFLDLVGPALLPYRRRLAYGSSLGAYAVLYYGQHGFDAIVASSPRNSAHPVLGLAWFQQQVPFQHAAFDPDQPATSPATVFYDPRDPTDRTWALREIAPAWPKLTLQPVPWAGHPANQYLSEIGYIAPFMRALLAGQPPPPLGRRDRGRSGMYLHVLALECHRRAKPRWALDLARRAAQRSPGQAMVERALAEVALAQGLVDEAEPLLRKLVQRLPADTAVQALLAQAQRQQAAAATPADASADASASAASAEPGAVPSAPADTARPFTESPVPPRPPQPPLAHRLRAWWHRTLLDGVRRFPFLARVSRDEVLWAYRTLLGREPESEDVVLRHMLAGSYRRLVRIFVESPEFARRVRSDASAPPEAAAPPAVRSTAPDMHPGLEPDVGPPTPDAAAGRPAVPRPDARLLVVGNCQAPGLAAVLRATSDLESAVPITLVADESRGHELMALHGPAATLWLSVQGQKLAREGFDRHASPDARWFNVPALQFNAFHPDVCYAWSRQTQKLTRSHYNSVLVAWAYANGLDEGDAAQLFRRDVYRALGYLDAWTPAVTGLRQVFAMSDLREDFADFMLHVQRQGCFMHTPNHPRLDTIAHVSTLVARRAGLGLRRPLDPGELSDGLNAIIWPVYPEISRELGLGAGSTTWKLLGAGSYIDGVPAFVAHAYADYRSQDIAPADLEIRYRDAAAIDAVLRRVTGRGGPARAGA